MSHEDKLQFEPVVQGLTEVKVVTGEEEEDTVFKMRARIFRFAREAVIATLCSLWWLCAGLARGSAEFCFFGQVLDPFACTER
jgi:hypothetical protein